MFKRLDFFLNHQGLVKGMQNTTLSDTKVACSSLETAEPRREKTSLRSFRPGPTQTGL